MIQSRAVLLFIVVSLVSINIAAQTISESLKKRAKAALSKNLKDPGSARLDNLFTTRAKDGSLVLCGTIDAKNSFGAYGDRRWFFYVDDKKDAFGAMEGDGLESLIKVFCAEAPAGAK